MIDLLKQLIAPIELTEERLQDISREMVSHPPRSVRMREDRTSILLPFPTDSIPWLSTGRWLCNADDRPSQFPNYGAADYYIQDAGSMLALGLLDAQPNESICDLCAAPGGKASGVLERLGEGGWLLANEPIQSRVDILEWSLTRTGNPRWNISSLDPEPLARDLQETFDAVLVDAPCSGQTLLGRGKRSENAFDLRQVDHSAQRQRRILESAIRMLKPGGRLIYSTCTFATAENEAQMQWLIDEHPGAWEPIEREDWNAWRSPIQAGCYRLWPDRDHCAGAFAAGLRLVGELRLEPLMEVPENYKAKSRKGDRGRVKSVARFSTKDLAGIGELHGMNLERRSDSLIGIPEDIAELTSSHSFRMPMLGSYHSSGMIPNHSLAMLRSEYFQPQSVVELDDLQALAYMRGEALGRLSSTDGWCIATWNQRPLGWVKQSHQRCNNHLPKDSRITS